MMFATSKHVFKSKNVVNFFKITIRVLHLTNKFLVAVRLFSNRSQMTSQYGDTKKVAHEPSGKCVTDVICYSTDLRSTTEQTHGNMEPTVFFVP